MNLKKKYKQKMNYQRDEFNQKYRYINKIYQSINAILIFIIQKLDIINVILGIPVIYAYIYNKIDIIYFSILDTLLTRLRSIRGFISCFNIFINFYIVNIGIEILHIISEEIENQNTEVIRILRNLYRELD